MVSIGGGIADPLDVEIGARVRDRRKAIGISQTELGHRIGVTFQQVQKYERGVNRIAGSTLVRVAKALGTSVAALVGETGDGAEGGPDAAALVRGFAAIGDVRVRRAVVEFVNRLASG